MRVNTTLLLSICYHNEVQTLAEKIVKETKFFLSLEELINSIKTMQPLSDEELFEKNLKRLMKMWEDDELDKWDEWDDMED